MTFYTYMLTCNDGSLYTGWTSQLEHRVKQHNLGRGAKYTRSRLPVRLTAYWRFTSRSEAMQWEYFLKQQSRQQKLHWLAQAHVRLEETTD
jgi:putative endonuclease